MTLQEPFDKCYIGSTAELDKERLFCGQVHYHHNYNQNHYKVHMYIIIAKSSPLKTTCTITSVQTILIDIVLKT